MSTKEAQMDLVEELLRCQAIGAERLTNDAAAEIKRLRAALKSASLDPDQNSYACVVARKALSE